MTHHKVGHGIWLISLQECVFSVGEEECPNGVTLLYSCFSYVTFLFLLFCFRFKLSNKEWQQCSGCKATSWKGVRVTGPTGGHCSGVGGWARAAFLWGEIWGWFGKATALRGWSHATWVGVERRKCDEDGGAPGPLHTCQICELHSTVAASCGDDSRQGAELCLKTK